MWKERIAADATIESRRIGVSNASKAVPNDVHKDLGATRAVGRASRCDEVHDCDDHERRRYDPNWIEQEAFKAQRHGRTMLFSFVVRVQEASAAPIGHGALTAAGLSLDGSRTTRGDHHRSRRIRRPTRWRVVFATARPASSSRRSFSGSATPRRPARSTRSATPLPGLLGAPRASAAPPPRDRGTPAEKAACAR